MHVDGSVDRNELAELLFIGRADEYTWFGRADRPEHWLRFGYLVGPLVRDAGSHGPADILYDRTVAFIGENR